MRDLIRRVRRSDRRGIAALEFGLLAPLFLLLLAGVVDLANAYVAKSLLDATVSSAANYGLLNNAAQTNAVLADNLGKIIGQSTNDHWFNGTVVINNGATATITNGATSVSGTVNNNCYCPTGTGGAPTWGGAVTCGSNCTGGGLAGNFIAISANYVYVPIFAVSPFSGTMTVTAMVQTK